MQLLMRKLCDNLREA